MDALDKLLSAMYFRKTVNIPDLSVYAGFQISSKFDDGIVIWVNGVEAYRNNINANPAYADLAPAAIANNGADVYTTVLGVSKFDTPCFMQYYSYQQNILLRA